MLTQLWLCRDRWCWVAVGNNLARFFAPSRAAAATGNPGALWNDREGERVKSLCLGWWRFSFLLFFFSCPYKEPRARIKLPSESKPNPEGWGKRERETPKAGSGHAQAPLPAGCRPQVLWGAPRQVASLGDPDPPSRPASPNSPKWRHLFFLPISAAPAPPWINYIWEETSQLSHLIPNCRERNCSEQRLTDWRKLFAKVFWCFALLFNPLSYFAPRSRAGEPSPLMRPPRHPMN